MRLLMISSDTAVVTGKHGAFWNTLRGLHAHWDAIDVICPYVSEPAALTVFGNVRFHPLPRSRLLAPLGIRRLGLRICAQRRPDLIVAHAYGFQRQALGGLLLARAARLPLVVEVHHVDGFPRAASRLDPLRRRAGFLFLKVASSRARAFRVVNRVELQPLLESLGIAPERILCLYAIYLDTRTFRPDVAVEKRYDMIFVGRLVPNKALPVLLDAFERVRERRPRARFLIVGRGPLEPWLGAELARRRLEGCVEHVPWVEEQADLARLYQRSRVVVCASYAEGGPRFTVEGMACGLPVVSTPVGLMRELLSDGRSGRLASSWSPDELARQVLALLGDDALYRDCAEHAIAAAGRFEYERTIGAYARGYRELVEHDAS